MKYALWNLTFSSEHMEISFYIKDTNAQDPAPIYYWTFSYDSFRYNKTQFRLSCKNKSLTGPIGQSDYSMQLRIGRNARLTTRTGKESMKLIFQKFPNFFQAMPEIKFLALLMMRSLRETKSHKKRFLK
jgi:hypothetical protein